MKRERGNIIRLARRLFSPFGGLIKKSKNDTTERLEINKYIGLFGYHTLHLHLHSTFI